jgi:hypothetical protein
MVTDVLPEKGGLGRDMGIWQMSISSVQIVAGAAGTVLMLGNRYHAGFGYQVLFCIAGLAVASGGYVSRFVKESR